MFGINKLSLELNDSTKHLTIFAELDGLVYKMIVIGRFVVGLLIIIIIGLYLKKLTCATYDKNKYNNNNNDRLTAFDPGQPG